MASNLRIHSIIQESIVDGPGIRMTVFTQGCPHHCPGCHNPQTHDFYGGQLIDVSSVFNQYKENPLLRGITFSGGEPFAQPEALFELGQMVKSVGGTVITYTGYLYEDLLEMGKSNPAILSLLSVSDWLIDGPYVEELRSLELEYRGSSNQRILLKKGDSYEFTERK
ncbi:MAG: anaerobic ribonucleoside-triphosphate reductase activating protein [Eubacteriales bacterium]|nr:anaerobic ribonucleoside-triphosphate reductase activating protein [Eubacteriales bacterium]